MLHETLWYIYGYPAIYITRYTLTSRYTLICTMSAQQFSLSTLPTLESPAATTTTTTTTNTTTTTTTNKAKPILFGISPTPKAISSRHAYTDEEKEFIRELYLTLPIDKRFETIQEKFKEKYDCEIKRGTYYKIVRDLSTNESTSAAVPAKKPRAKPRMTDSSKYPEFEKRMLNWLRRTKYRDCIEVPVMMEKAQKVFKENILPTLPPDTVVPAFGKGWCIGFLTRHGFNYRTRRLRGWFFTPDAKRVGVSKNR